jgi:hypothetical protein
MLKTPIGKTKKIRQKSKNDSIKKAKNKLACITKGTFLQNYRKSCQVVSKIQARRTDGRMD